MADKDEIHEALEFFEIASEAERENREAALDDLKFSKLSEQWDEALKEKRLAQSKPVLTINKMQAFIRQVVNDSRLNKPSIIVNAADSFSDPDTAELIEGLIRAIERSSDAEIAYDVAVESSVIGGFGYFRVDVDYSEDDSFDLDIRIEAIPNPFSVYGDPYSTRPDSRDWNIAFVIDSLTKKEFGRKYKGAAQAGWEESYRDMSMPWLDGDQIQIAEFWQREQVAKQLVKMSNGDVLYDEIYLKNKQIFDELGVTVIGERKTRGYKVTQKIMSGKEILETNDWKGKFIPIIPVYGEIVNVEGKIHRIGLIRDAKDSQRMFNYWRTVSCELGALAPKTPFIGPVGAFSTDSHKWATINTESWPYVEYDGGIPPQRQPFAGVPAGALQEALNASDDMKAIIGIYDAGLGARSNETSGKAILARQRESDVSNFHFTDNLNRSIRHAGRVIIDLIPHVYNSERVLRVLGPDHAPEAREVRINAPFQMKDGTEKIYDLTVGKYDVVVSSGPSFSTQREEASAQMMELVRVFPQSAGVIGDLIAKNQNWPGAEEIAKRLKLLLPKELQGIEEDDLPAEAIFQIRQLEQQLQQMQQMGQQGMELIKQQQQEIERLKIDTSDKSRKVDVDAFNAETNRLKAVLDNLSQDEKVAIYAQVLGNILTNGQIL